MSSLSIPSSPCSRSNLDDEIVISVSGESTISSCRSQEPNSLPVEPITRDLILEIDLTDWRSDIVRVKPLLRRNMFKSDLGAL